MSARFNNKTTEGVYMKKNKENKIKDIKNKPTFSVVPCEIMYAIEMTRQYGIKKYGNKKKWKKIDVKYYYEALYRHIIKIINGEKEDSESGLPHIYHAACNIAFIISIDSGLHLWERFIDEKKTAE